MRILRWQVSDDSAPDSLKDRPDCEGFRALVTDDLFFADAIETEYLAAVRSVVIFFSPLPGNPFYDKGAPIPITITMKPLQIAGALILALALSTIPSILNDVETVDTQSLIRS